MPFSIESNIDFDSLRIKIGGKLDMLPGLLNLRYRLNTEKAKQAITSIASADELSIFVDRMRALLYHSDLPTVRYQLRLSRPSQ
jgi:hypothetical protein